MGVGGWRSLVISYVFTGSGACLSRFFIPKSVVVGGEEVYLNVNLGHEVWKDVNKFEFIRIEEGLGAGGYLGRLCGKWCGFNTVCWGFMWMVIEVGKRISKMYWV